VEEDFAAARQCAVAARQCALAAYGAAAQLRCGVGRLAAAAQWHGVAAGSGQAGTAVALRCAPAEASGAGLRITGGGPAVRSPQVRRSVS
jgi:hypothetical protein